MISAKGGLKSVFHRLDHFRQAAIRRRRNPAAMEKAMSKTNPSPEQFAVLDYVCTMQRQFEVMLRRVGLIYAAERLAKFEDPTEHTDDVA